MRDKVCEEVRAEKNEKVSTLTKKFDISEEDLKFTRRIFQKFDSNSDGKLSKWELIEAFIYLGLIAFSSGDIQVCSRFNLQLPNFSGRSISKIKAFGYQKLNLKFNL